MKKTWYERIAELRIDHDIPQREIAAYLHIGQSSYSDYERGISRLPLDILVALADYYGVTTDEILGHEKQNGHIKSDH